MNFDIDLLQEMLNDTTEGVWTSSDTKLLKWLFNDTTEGKWKSADTKLLISTLNGDYDVYDVQSCGDAAFIAHVHNVMPNIISALYKIEFLIDMITADDDTLFDKAYESGNTTAVDEMLEQMVADALEKEQEVDLYND